MASVLVASSNPVKISAVQDGFSRIFPDLPLEVLGLDVPSGVADQPVGDGETRRGALNRAREAARQQPGLDFFVGIEGGIEEVPGEPMPRLRLGSGAEQRAGGLRAQRVV